MNNNYWSYCLYPLFLSTVDSCTLASVPDQELQDELDHLALRAVARFKYPKIPLVYNYDEVIEDTNMPVVERKSKGYYFINAVTQKEINVVLAWMKVYWLEYQLSKERNYENLYIDKDVTTFSPGGLLNSIKQAYSEYSFAARKEEESYYRVSADGKPAVGLINVDI